MPLPRFQFRLRTLLIGVALLSVPCAYVGWQYKIVRERTAWLAAHPQGVLAKSYPARGWACGRTDRSKDPSALRLWLGDVGHDRIFVSYYSPQEEGDKAIALFPEAELFEAQ